MTRRQKDFRYAQFIRLALFFNSSPSHKHNCSQKRVFKQGFLIPWLKVTFVFINKAIACSSVSSISVVFKDKVEILFSQINREKLLLNIKSLPSWNNFHFDFHFGDFHANGK